jgi:magnesium transporter
LARFNEATCERLLESIPRQAAKEFRELLTYPEGSAGRLMDPRVHAFRPEVTAGEALDRLRRAIGRRVHDIFVVDDDGRLTGTVSIQALALADNQDRLATLLRPAPAQVSVTAGEDEVAELLETQALVTLPVVDFEGCLVGVLRSRALMDAVEHDATADIQSMVGASKEERALSPVSFAVRKRLPWLQINLVTAFLAAAVVGLFEDTIARFTALAVLLPVVAGQSGNTGSQALAVTLRGLALREVRLGLWPRVTLKEAGVGVINGVAVAVVTALGVFIWSRSAGLCLVIGVAMVISMALAGVTGAIIPMALSAVGQDPAQSSSIILTTVTDIVGFFSFLGLATVFAGLL